MIVLTKARQDEACRLAARGMKLRDIQVSLGFTEPLDWLLAWGVAGPDALSAFKRARNSGLETLADDRLLDDKSNCLTVVDVMRERLADDNYKWLLGKRLPDAYGANSTVTLATAPDMRRLYRGMAEGIAHVDQARQLTAGDDEGAALLAMMLDES